MNTGLLQALMEEESLSDLHIEHKLAVIVSHEIAHALARHQAEHISHSALSFFPPFALLMAASPLLIVFYNTLLRLPYSRVHETEADFIGKFSVSTCSFAASTAFLQCFSPSLLLQSQRCAVICTLLPVLTNFLV